MKRAAKFLSRSIWKRRILRIALYSLLSLVFWIVLAYAAVFLLYRHALKQAPETLKRQVLVQDGEFLLVLETQVPAALAPVMPQYVLRLERANADGGLHLRTIPSLFQEADPTPRLAEFDNHVAVVETARSRITIQMPHVEEEDKQWYPKGVFRPAHPSPAPQP